MKTDIVARVEALIIRTKEFHELERELSYFCPFEAMGMTDQEIRHAHFLSYVLDPNRPHGFGDTFIRAFLKVATQKALSDDSLIRPIDIHLMDLNEVRIGREQDRIDLQIEIPKHRSRSGKRAILVFELKIRAKEGKDQLQRYEEKTKAQNAHCDMLFFYLTLDGADPSEENRDTWTPLALGDVIDEFSTVVDRSAGDEGAKRIVHAYIAMMRREHVGAKNDKLQQLARELWAEHKEALEFLSQYQPDDVSDFLADLNTRRDDLCTFLRSETSWEFVVDGDSSPRSVILYPTALDRLNAGPHGRRVLVLIIDRNYGDRDKLRFRWLIRPGSKEVREAVYAKIGGNKPMLKPEWTQIHVARMELNISTDLGKIQKAVATFVNETKGRFDGLI